MQVCCSVRSSILQLQSASTRRSKPRKKRRCKRHLPAV